MGQCEERQHAGAGNRPSDDAGAYCYNLARSMQGVGRQCGISAARSAMVRDCKNYLALTISLSLILIGQSLADAPKGSDVLPPEVRKEAEAAIERGFAYLKNSQDAAGGWTPKYGAAITAIVGQAF